MKIRIITTGGTIEGLEFENEDDRLQEVNVDLRGFLEASNVSFEYVFDFAFQKDSRFISNEDRALIVSKIVNSQEDKILITHGTLTMIETSQFLGGHNLDKVVVLVGSFILGSAENSDASFNLGYAIHALQTLDVGVYIAMNGQVFSWKNVKKNSIASQYERDH
ncbi:asparaginase domain-containing protein [uncultured Maribacter sp.]|uniref:asparaginase domain-containing protein n=1 Tax=uncultured Maribacter sp. TaxID=431308 RepID=UPI00262CCBEC|nr:asparaginase domain-containing protein [uncultured Maribacter sp.]